MQDSSLESVFIENRAQLWRVARKIVNTPDLADDVLQDAYLKLVDCPCQRQANQPLGYCHQVVRNMALDYCRRHRVESTYRTFNIEVETLEVPAIDTPDRNLCTRQVVAGVERALSKLPCRARTVFELYRVEGMTQREIAQNLGCALGLVNGLIAEATAAISGFADLLLDPEAR
ncbi:sigma-70 family RNA polymerase sigma factor [Diaphorobacter aerolatus]|uniref:Sigma-70 family RNA polymerase sigma factor n=2 Tax=Diaphorobacter aerolatus TaxID=1288495 RepID=A0A7H0GQQ3_9BURK|nr:sigma-70 family RNA polymerase sigma factor [Diaphorobacter aerolatus]